MPDPDHDWAPEIRARLTSLRLTPVRESEIIDELVQHVEERRRELVAAGATRDGAVRIARTEFDGTRLEAQLGRLQQAHCPGAPSPGSSRALSLESLVIDLRHAFRALRATPSFTIGALLVLALGTGATTAIFSVVDAVAFRPLPFPESDRLVAVGMRADGPDGSAPRGGPQRGPASMGAMPGAKPPDPDALMNVAPRDYVEWVDRQQVFEAIAAINDTGDVVLQPTDGEPEIVHGQRVTASFFDVLRVRPLLGSVFTSDHEVADNDRVVVVSHAFWQRHLGGNQTAVGDSLTLNGASYVILGVMPESFAYRPSSQRVDFWTPWNPRPQAGGRTGAIALGGLRVLRV